MNAHRKQDLRAIVDHIPAAAVTDVLADGGEIAGPLAGAPSLLTVSLMVSAVGDVVEPCLRHDLIGAPPALFQHELPETRKVADRRTDPTGTARRALAIERDIGPAVGAHRLPQQVTDELGKAPSGGAFDRPAEQVGVRGDIGERPAVSGGGCSQVRIEVVK